MNAKLTIAILTVAITLTAIVRPASASNTTDKAGTKATAHLVVSVEETNNEPTGPAMIGTSTTNSTRGAVIYVEPVRKVKHTDTPAVHIFDDGSTSDGQCLPGGSCNLNDDGAIIFEDGSWVMPDGTTGCLPWGICNLE